MTLNQTKQTHPTSIAIQITKGGMVGKGRKNSSWENYLKLKLVYFAL